jgi:hypothetical protein
MSQPAENAPENMPTDAPPPFDDPDADIILRSCDGVQFRTYKLLLSLASPIFKDMLTIPQPQLRDEDQGNVPVVDLTETSTTIHNLLCCYHPAIDPFDTHDAKSLSEIADFAQAAQKYEMRLANNTALRLLVQPRFLEAEPLRIFVFAYRLQAKAEARLAAKYTLRRPLLIQGSFTELELVNAMVLFRIQLYHQKCTRAAAKAARSHNWIVEGRSLAMQANGLPQYVTVQVPRTAMSFLCRFIIGGTTSCVEQELGSRRQSIPTGSLISNWRLSR